MIPVVFYRLVVFLKLKFQWSSTGLWIVEHEKLVLRDIYTKDAAPILICTKETSVTIARKVDVLLMLVKISVIVEVMKIFVTALQTWIYLLIISTQLMVLQIINLLTWFEYLRWKFRFVPPSLWSVRSAIMTIQFTVFSIDRKWTSHSKSFRIVPVYTEVLWSSGEDNIRDHGFPNAYVALTSEWLSGRAGTPRNENSTTSGFFSLCYARLKENSVQTRDVSRSYCTYVLDVGLIEEILCSR